MYRILISLGSNIYSKQNIDRAKRMLVHYFPDVVFTRSIITASSDERCLFPFRNVLAVFNSELSPEEIIHRLKSVESAMGRQYKDKETGKVIIDIDLIVYNGEVLRAADYEKDYVQELLGEIAE